MAIMVPGDPPPPDEAPESETAVWRIMEADLPDSWTVHHRFPWLHRNQRGVPERSDIDFLAMHPMHGILAIEVKGGLSRYEASEDRWYRNTPDGEKPLKRAYSRAPAALVIRGTVRLRDEGPLPVAPARRRPRR